MAHSVDKRIILYPNYLDSAQTVAQGRVLSKDQACLGPDVMEMYECCKTLNIEAEMEDKQYPRTWWIRGRLRVKLKDSEGRLVNPAIPNKRALLIKISELIKKNPNRPKRMNIMQATVQASQQFALANGPSGAGASGAAGAGGAAGKAGASSGSTNKKKKGKK